jgi:hypothetical protein
MLARIGVMRALNRHGHRVLEPSGKKHHWGRRKLARATDDTRYLRDLPTVVPSRESPRLTGPGIPTGCRAVGLRGIGSARYCLDCFC